VTTYLLDSNTISFIMEKRPRVLSRLDAAMQSDWLITCTIVRGEILYGLERMPQGRKRQLAEAEASVAFEYVQCEAVPERAADIYARIKRDAELDGTAQGENDLWIAATTLALDAVLVSSDTDFRRVRGLPLEDWLA